ncbi:methyl-accepting chemotaxis protein [Undibacterium sp. GrIS 1.2]|uniref:methyl-accepting chemotaxis protein n=1 Tax=Undibacterium sp. GrIS 1.2 TaxID=3143933 RepID=UPI0033998C92
MLKKFIRIGSWNIGARLALFMFIIVGATLVTLIALINYSTNQQIEQRTALDVTDKTKMVADMLNIFDAGLRSQVSVDAKIFEGSFKGAVGLDPSRSIDVAGTATPVLKSGDGDLNGNFPVLDQFTSLSGAIATLFVKKDNDFIRVSTTLKKENGERAVGTVLDHTNPAFEIVSGGKSYVGIATIFGKQYMTQYDPIIDSGGKVIGIFFVGVNFTEAITQLKDKIRAMKIGDTGYFYALDAREGKNLGTLIIHPSKEGQIILDSKDSSGREFIKEILERKEGVIRYPWVNTERGESETREKIVAFMPIKNWNWIVAGGVYTDEFTRDATALAHRYEAIGVILLLCLGGALYYVMRVRLSLPLQTVINAARNLAQGDLRTHISSTRVDEIGQLIEAINSIGTGLAEVVMQVRASTSEISLAADEISNGNADLSARSESQASSLEQTAASMQELTGTVKKNSESAKTANDLVVSAAGVATKGGQVVSQVISTMASIKESSKRIVDIISVIDGIAFQTNILALNAAVEAARAGEQGRGFAVVASEVRNLAQRSAAAAKEIASLIQDSVAKVDAGNLLAEQTGNTMTAILESVDKVTHIMAEISSASIEQSSGIEQVNQAVGQMDEMTQQNAALVEEAAAAAEAMSEQVNAMAKIVGVFKIEEPTATVTKRLQKSAVSYL